MAAKLQKVIFIMQTLVDKLQFENLTCMNINEIINEKINEIINVQLMIINVQNNARSAPKLKR